MPPLQVTLGLFGSAIYREADRAFVAFHAAPSDALAACAPGQIVVPSVLSRSGLVPAPAPQNER